MTGFVLNKPGFVLNMTGFVKNMTGIVRNMTILVLNLTVFVLNMTGFVLHPPSPFFVTYKKPIYAAFGIYKKKNEVKYFSFL